MDQLPPATPSPMPSPAPAQSLLIPHWIQLVGLPLLILFAWLFATAAGHAVVTFTIAALVSLLLNPIVRRMVIGGVPRPVAVMVVFSVFSLVLTLAVIAMVNVTVGQAERVRTNLPQYIDQAESKIDDTERLLEGRGLNVDLRDQGTRFFDQLETQSSELSGSALEFGRDFVREVAGALFALILIVVVTVYMLLDAPRIGHFVVGLFPPEHRADVLFRRIEHSLIDYVRGQTAASLVMGASAALGLWLMGVTGFWKEATGLALLFGLIVALTEFAPSIGPFLGSIPPVVAALFAGPWQVIGVVVFFLILHQIEGHIVVPKLMGSAVGVHPLLVIFGIIAGIQIGGFVGVVLVLPLLAVGKQVWLFVRETVRLQTWSDVQLMAAAQPAVAAAVAGSAAANVDDLAPVRTPRKWWPPLGPSGGASGRFGWLSRRAGDGGADPAPPSGGSRTADDDSTNANDDSTDDAAL